MSDSVRPQRRQPTSLPRPWDSPGKNTGVVCHFLLQCMKVKSENEVAQLCPTPSDLTDWSPPGSSVHGISQARILQWVAISFSRDLPDSGIEPATPACPALAGGFFTPEPPGKPSHYTNDLNNKLSANRWLLVYRPELFQRQWQPTPVLLPGKSHGWRGLVGCSPWGSLGVGFDWATSLSLFTFMHWRRKWQPTPVFLPGESQGQGAWWAAVYGVAQSQIRLKRLSSSSSFKH